MWYDGDMLLVGLDLIVHVHMGVHDIRYSTRSRQEKIPDVGCLPLGKRKKKGRPSVTNRHGLPIQVSRWFLFH